MEYVTIEELSKAVGVPKKKINRWLEQGLLTYKVIDKRRRFDIEQVRDEIDTILMSQTVEDEDDEQVTISDKGKGRNARILEADEVPSVSISNRKIAYVKATRMEMELKKELGALVSVDELSKFIFNSHRAFRDSILNLPDKLKDELAVKTDSREIRKILLDALRRELEGLCEQLEARI